FCTRVLSQFAMHGNSMHKEKRQREPVSRVGELSGAAVWSYAVLQGPGSAPRARSHKPEGLAWRTVLSCTICESDVSSPSPVTPASARSAPRPCAFLGLDGWIPSIPSSWAQENEDNTDCFITPASSPERRLRYRSA